jgi:hypothetical protein
MIRLTSTFRTLLVALVAASAACLPLSVRAESIANPIAVFNGLDKITARITRFEVPIDRTALFGTIEVTPRVCHTKPPTEPPQTTAFVEVNERRHEGEPRRIFTGWMFADSPGLSGVEHPVYDVWLTGCKTASG